MSYILGNMVKSSDYWKDRVVDDVKWKKPVRVVQNLIRMAFNYFRLI